MRGQVSQRYDQLIGVMRIALILSGSTLMAAAFVGGVAPSSGGNDNAAPVQLSADEEPVDVATLLAWHAQAYAY